MDFGRIPLVATKHRVDLTPEGRIRIENDNIAGVRGDIMWYIKEHGASSPKVIAEQTGIAPPRVKGVINELTGKDYKWFEWV